MTLAIALLLVCGADGDAEDKRLKRLANACLQWQEIRRNDAQALVDYYKDIIARGKRGRIRDGVGEFNIPEKGPVEFPNAKARKSYVALWTEEAEKAGIALKKYDGPGAFPPPLPYIVAVGDLGSIVGVVEVVQVIDGNTATVRGKFGVKRIPPAGRGIPRVEWEQRRDTIDVFLTGVDTSTMADEARLEVPGVFEVTGNRSYTTVTGAKRTLLVLERVPTDDLEATVEKLR